MYADSDIPSVTLGNMFAECFKAFAVCPRHTAKSRNPVVMFVHEPSMATAKALLDTLRVTTPTSFAEQVSELAVGMHGTGAQALHFGWRHACSLFLVS